MAELIIEFKDKKEIELKLLKNKEVLDMLTIKLDIHLDTLLVTSIDKILKRNRIDTLSLSDVRVAGSVEPSSVAYLVAKAIAEALKTKH